MLIDVYFTYNSCINNRLSEQVAVVIDVLRATSSIITALEAGATAVIPLAQVADALALQVRLPGALLAGEREGERLEGFDFGNSPYEFTAETVGGRTVIACTTNGTAAVSHAATAKELWLGALLNAQAVAREALAQNVGELAIICAGTDHHPSIDDTLAAGAIIYHLQREISLNEQDMNDTALMALNLYRGYADADIYPALASCFHGRKLIRFGRGLDVRYCAQQNISAMVPKLDTLAPHPCFRKNSDTP